MSPRPLEQFRPGDHVCITPERAWPDWTGPLVVDAPPHDGVRFVYARRPDGRVGAFLPSNLQDIDDDDNRAIPE